MNYTILNFITAIILSIVIIFGWQHFYEKPRIQKIIDKTKLLNDTTRIRREPYIEKNKEEGYRLLDRSKSVISSIPRVKISSQVVSGSISLKGLRFDNLTLLEYGRDLTKDSPAVALFSPSNSKQSYFAEIGWWNSDQSITYPNASTIWHTDKSELTEGQSVNLTWSSPENVLFKVTIELDEHYMFTIQQATYNQSGRAISTQYYGLINRDYETNQNNVINILHQGMIGVISGKLQELSYDKIKDRKKESFTRGEVNWLGITDKYWLAAFIPDSTEHYSANYHHSLYKGCNKYQADFITPARLIANNEIYKLTHRLFAGAKKVNLLDEYEKKYNIKLFDRAIDFGWFYILTKPIFNAMNFFYKYVGNFGISIMIVTVIIKLFMFTLANKSYRSMKKIKNLQPKIEMLKSLYAEDKVRLNQEVMQLYKKEKVNPLSGCLPLLVQIPVFFSIYKVLYVTIEMRHAPFFGWIKDLSAPDPTTIFNIFGLIPFTPPSFLMIGVWPLIMAVSMYCQQQMSPQSSDPIQAQVIKIMPLMFLFMFSNFPAGLLIYWSWNNLLSIIQQLYINKLDKDNAD